MKNFNIYWIQYIKWIDELLKFIFHKYNFVTQRQISRHSCFFLTETGTWASNLSRLSTLQCSRVTQTFLLARSSTSTTLWAGLTGSSMALGIVVWELGTSFPLYQGLLPQWPAGSSITWIGKNRSLSFQDFVFNVVSLEIFELYIQKLEKLFDR